MNKYYPPDFDPAKVSVYCVRGETLNIKQKLKWYPQERCGAMYCTTAFISVYSIFKHKNIMGAVLNMYKNIMGAVLNVYLRVLEYS